MNVLVLGGDGFIGRHLVKLLLEKDCKIRILSRRPQQVPPNPKIEYIHGDFTNSDTIDKALVGIDYVYHLISTTIPKSSNDNPIFDIESNLLATVRLLEGCVKHSVKKIIFSSSGGTIYGVPQTFPITEEHPTNPICSYGITKLAIEKYLDLFYNLHNLNYTVLRIANPYGEYQDTFSQQGAIAVFLGKVSRGEPIHIWGDGNVVRDYVYVADVVEALHLAASSDNKKKVLNVGSGVGLSLNQLLDKIKVISGVDITVKYETSRSFDVPVSVLDINQAQRELNWTPRVSIDLGLSNTWQWILGKENDDIKIS